MVGLRTATGLQLLLPTSDSRDEPARLHALTRIFRPGIHYAKCGVMLTELMTEGTEQRDLFDASETQSNVA